jgi:hypothetical protein
LSIKGRMSQRCKDKYVAPTTLTKEECDIIDNGTIERFTEYIEGLLKKDKEEK